MEDVSARGRVDQRRGSTVTRPMRPLGKINGLVAAQEEETPSAPGPVP
jgi:hypothetical protein